MSSLSVTWDTYFADRPANGDSPQQVDDRIRETRLAMEERLGREHLLVASDVFDTNNNQGYHRPGSAMAYYQTAAPTTLPDSADALASGALSNGRLWVNTSDDGLYYYKVGTWTRIQAEADSGAHMVAGQLYTASSTLGALYTALASDMASGESILVSGGFTYSTYVYTATYAWRSGSTITLYVYNVSLKVLHSFALTSGLSTAITQVSLAW